jgi:hypothetical protein
MNNNRDIYLYYEGLIFQKIKGEMNLNLISITTLYDGTDIKIPEKITGIHGINDRNYVGDNRWDNGDYNVIGIDSIIKTPPSGNIKKRMGRKMDNIAIKEKSSITSITIPTSVTSIGENAFEGCSKLISLSFSSTSKVKSIGARAFLNCTSLQKLIIPDSVVTIGVSVFEGCSLLGDVTIGNGLISIGANAFKLTRISTIVIPASVTTIGASAFEGCSKLTRANILSTSEFTVGENSFKACPLLFSIVVQIDKPNITSAVFDNTDTNSVYLVKGGDGKPLTLIKFFPRGSQKKINFVTGGAGDINFATIETGAFSNVLKLYKLRISGSTTIKSGAFVGCTNLYGIVVTGTPTLEKGIITGSTNIQYIFVNNCNLSTINPPEISNPVFPLTDANVKIFVNNNFIKNNIYQKLFGTKSVVYANGDCINNETVTFIDLAKYNNLLTYINGNGTKPFIIPAASQSAIPAASQSAIPAASQSAIPAASQSAIPAANKSVEPFINSGGQTITESFKEGAIDGQEELQRKQSILQKVKSINFAIDEIKSEQNRNNRHSYFFSEDTYINLYRNRVALILYYIVFILLALSLYLNRESYSIVMIVILLIIFALLPFVIKYLTRFAYDQFLGLVKLFYDGNVRYLNSTDK